MPRSNFTKSELSAIVAGTLLLSACQATTTAPNSAAHSTPNQSAVKPITKPTVSTTSGSVAAAHSSLQFDPSAYTTQTISVGDKQISVRAYENIPYVANPVEPDYQLLNIYIPEGYFAGETINGYTADTAPIFFPNGVGGYMPAKPLTPAKGRDGRDNSVAVALTHGFVVASAGARGRTLQGNGSYTGKAPAAIVDLKAAIRYLKFNDARMIGSANKIISNGTSAGGALSALLGASGGSQDYHSALNALGAAPAGDDIFAVSAYCPITNLDNADMAYEWQYAGLDNYRKMHITMLDYNVERKLVDGTLSDTDKAVSAKLAVNFPNYINQLNLINAQGKRLSLNQAGEGSFKEEIISHLNQSANRAAKAGADMSSYTFLAQNKSSNPYYIADFKEFLKNHAIRSKTVPAFDALDLSSGENNLFGDTTTDNRHFTAFGVQNASGSTASADPKTVAMMNAMNYIDTTNVQHWRIRHGAKDSDTSFAVPVILATKLQMAGKQVDFAMPWNQGHGGDYDLDELFLWIHSIAKDK